MDNKIMACHCKALSKAEHAAKQYRALWQFAVAILFIMALIIGMLLGHIEQLTDKVVIVTQTETATPAAVAVSEEPAEQVTTPAPTAPPVFYELTDEQRTLIEEVVSAESRGEPYEGQVAVAQCILNACLKHDIPPERAIVKYKYTTYRAEPTDSVEKAVAAVFDRGEGVTDEPIIYFYAPELVTSEFHESQDFVIEIGCHRFFKAAD